MKNATFHDLRICAKPPSPNTAHFFRAALNRNGKRARVNQNGEHKKDPVYEDLNLLTLPNKTVKKKKRASQASIIRFQDQLKKEECRDKFSRLPLQTFRASSCSSFFRLREAVSDYVTSLRIVFCSYFLTPTAKSWQASGYPGCSSSAGRQI